MSDLKYLRGLIDQQDQIIMEALEKRFRIAKEIGQAKKEQQLPLTNEGREAEVLRHCEAFQSSKHLKTIYQTIFTEAKLIQKETYGLAGKNISHSLSPLLHAKIGNLDYKIFEPESFETFIRGKTFEGLNVTIPYKEKAYELVDEADDLARKTKVVNTIVNDHGHLKGYNTDYPAFERLLDFFSITILDKRVLIIGNGATSRTVRAVIESRKPKMVVNLVRNVRGENEAMLSEYQEFRDFEIIINTTPYGSVPNLEMKPLFPLGGFYNLEATIDVIYQPLNSPFLMEASKINCRKTVNGLYMLIAQALYADELFLDKRLEPSVIDEIYQEFRRKLPNIILIGMPYSGKTTLGAMVAQMTDREFIDTDELLAKEAHDLKTLLKNGGTVEEFRQYETNLITKLSLKQNKVIATGGGAVINPQNVQNLKANGIIVWLSPTLEKLMERNNGTRPLAPNNEALEELYLERLNYYVPAKDIICNNNGEPEDDAKNLLEKFYEYLDYQWTQS